MEFWKDKKVLITGVGGFVGSNLAERLIKEGAYVVGINRQTPFNGEIAQIFGDITDSKVVDRVVGQYEIDSIFHLASQSILEVANRSPLYTLYPNIISTINVLEAGSKSSVERIILASSNNVYGEQESLPCTEESSFNAQGPYEVSKICSEFLIRPYNKIYNLPIGVARFGNIYGRGDLNFTRIVPNTIRSCLTKKAPRIYGDGSQIRKYTYIDDAISAYLTFAERLPDLEERVLNFESDERISVLDLVKKIIDLSKNGAKPIMVSTKHRVGEVRELYSSSKKAERLIGWRAKISLNEGLKRTIGWYRNYLGLIKPVKKLKDK